MSLLLSYKFKMWTWYHYLYIASPFIVLTVLWLLLRNKSDKTKYIVGVLIGILSVVALAMRNLKTVIADIKGLLAGGNKITPQCIPLQVCHFGNIAVFFALVFKSKIAASIAWSLNMAAAFASLIFADSLENYASVFSAGGLAYILGHFLIVVGAAYAIMMKIVRIDLKSYLYGCLIVSLLLGISIVLNPYFRNVLGDTGINYFYLYDAKGAPLDFLYFPRFTFKKGWFQFNWVYTPSCIAIFSLLMFGIFESQRLFYLKDKDYETCDIITEYRLKRKALKEG